ncbi:MAG TPA: chromate transporter [Herbaspirillum sp.]|jgi:chromate transporter
MNEDASDGPAKPGSVISPPAGPSANPSATPQAAFPETPDASPLPLVVPTSKDLFLGFLGLGMIAFGGALPLAHRMLVERKRWLDNKEFVEILGLCQFLPGGNIINVSVAIGMRFRGVRGALAAIGGLIAIPSVIIVLLGILYEHYQNDPHVRHLFAGLAAAAAGILVSMALKIVLPLRKNLTMAAIALVCCIAIAILRLPLLWIMLTATPISIWIVARIKK